MEEIFHMFDLFQEYSQSYWTEIIYYIATVTKIIFSRKVTTEIKREYNTTSLLSDGPISEGIKYNLVLSS